ncbi:GNAT family N-acetyltransferase [uncultured Chitinophaga sp.]|jgi:Acetyltransferases|uniref:GNAT family N-acetyltransferase n=1 Tax=uncultured Chitinophaga sp. TaxID=339340 RepID=UPI0026207BF3|nr:GNAT family N-acetyltransferase [uncultured Chitinophaga sp.]
MIRFETLENTPLQALCEAFNLAFSDYIVPVQLTLPLLEQKIQGEHIQLSQSIGAFSGQLLTGLILHGADTWPGAQMLYNGGTGVIPAFRGRRLVQQMYSQFKPLYRQQGIRRIILEVITTNMPAIKAYTSSGFMISRLFHCYKGVPIRPHVKKDIQFKEAVAPDWTLLNSFCDQLPSWSNSSDSIQREGPDTSTWIAYDKTTVMGFVSVYTGNKRIRQLAVHPQYRRQGIGTALLQHITKKLQGPFSITNITDENKGLQQFLLKAGFTPTISQYEMEMIS